MRKNKIIYKDFAALAEENVTVPAAGTSGYQNVENILNEDNRSIVNFASFEGQGINLLDPTLCFAEEGDCLGFVSEAISSGTKSLNVKLAFDLAGGYYSAPGITFSFHQNHCTEVHIEWIKDDKIVETATAYPNCLNFYFDKKVEDFNRILITFIKTSNSYQFVKLAGIDLGKTREINSFFGAINVFCEVSPDCSDLPGATCDFEALLTEDFNPQSEQELFLYSDDELIGKFIVDNATPNGDRRYSFECSDEITRLEKSEFPALPQGEHSVDGIVSKIKEASNIDIDSNDIGETTLTGFIKEGNNSRIAAAMISFATGMFVMGGKKKLRLCKPQNRRNKIIDSNQIIGRTIFRQNTPFTEVTLQTFNGDFETVSTEETTVNPSRKASDSNGVKVYNKYSLMSDAKARAEELFEMGFHWNEIEADIIVQDEKIGDILKIETAYNGVKTGIIKSMDMMLSTVVTAHVVIVERDFAVKGVER